MAYKKVDLSNSNYATVNANTVLNTNYATTPDWTYTNKSDTTGYAINGTYIVGNTTQSEIDEIKAQLDQIIKNKSENGRRKRI